MAVFITDFYRPQTKFGVRLYFYTCLSFCSRGGGWCYPSIHCRWYPNMPCSRVGCGVPGPVGGWSGGVPGPRGVCSWGFLVPGGLLLGGPGPRGCLVQTPQTATAAGSTHPTGMHSCLCCFYCTEDFMVELHCTVNYRTRHKLREGNVFTGICQSVDRGW